MLYVFSKYCFGEHFPGAPVCIPENRLVNMYCSGTQNEVKNKIVKLFKRPDANRHKNSLLLICTEPIVHYVAIT